MNNKVKAISHWAFGFRTTWTYIANIYHCCAELPLPRHFWDGSQRLWCPYGVYRASKSLKINHTSSKYTYDDFPCKIRCLGDFPSGVADLAKTPNSLLKTKRATRPNPPPLLEESCGERTVHQMDAAAASGRILKRYDACPAFSRP
jgi:hypothetical protein